MTINDFTYRGDIDFTDIREAICASYNKAPSNCNLERIWSTDQMSTFNGGHRGRDGRGAGAGSEGEEPPKAIIIGAVVGALLCFNCFVIAHIQRRVKRETNEELT